MPGSRRRWGSGWSIIRGNRGMDYLIYDPETRQWLQHWKGWGSTSTTTLTWTARYKDAMTWGTFDEAHRFLLTLPNRRSFYVSRRE